MMFPNLQPFSSPTSNHPLLLHHHPLFSATCFRGNKRLDSLSFVAAGRDSEFEIDPDKARDALRKLDKQFDLISKKQDNPPLPKTKASSPYSTTEEVTKDTGSFLPFAFFGLLIFTIVYNIVFIQVIKPSIDGPQAELAPVRSSIMTQILRAQ